MNSSTIDYMLFIDLFNACKSNPAAMKDKCYLAMSACAANLMIFMARNRAEDLALVSDQFEALFAHFLLDVTYLSDAQSIYFRLLLAYGNLMQTVEVLAQPQELKQSVFRVVKFVRSEIKARCAYKRDQDQGNLDRIVSEFSDLF